ncbi:MAG: extracellular solute-binding protein, partial [Chloroflexota bacterium]|nr:extracellular solute-binding protein [Chloroflexota bacterium]
SGSLLSQMKLSRSGDLYIPGSPDFMMKAERDGIVASGSAQIVAYLVPAIAVQSGNPRNIKSLADLARPGIKVAIADPASVCVGLYAIEILEHNGLLDDIQQAGTVVTYTESCEKTATLIALKSVDAVMGWDVFAAWNPAKIDVVYLPPAQTPRIAYIPAAISTFATDKENAQKFLDFLVSTEGQAIFLKAGYITTESEARKFAPNARIGGEYQLPATYKPLVK